MQYAKYASKTKKLLYKNRLNQESYTTLSLYIPVFCLSIFSTVLSLMQPGTVLWRELIHLSSNTEAKIALFHFKAIPLGLSIKVLVKHPSPALLQPL